jgi:predicted secreted protein
MHLLVSFEKFCRSAVLAAALGLFALARAAALSLHTPVLVATDASQVVNIPAGQEFFVALQSNEGSDYAWSARVSDTKIVAYEGNVRQPAAATVPSQQIFVFHANRTGSTTIDFSYTSDVSPGAAPPRTVRFTIQVQ